MTQMPLIIAQPVIETERFDLRPLRRSDEGLLRMYTSEARVAKMTSRIPHPLAPGVTEAFIKRAQSDDRVEDVWAIDGTKSGDQEIMGVISLNRMDRDQSELGYLVAPAYWGTGIASEVVGALIDANPLNNTAIFADVFQDNPASGKVLTNCGFQYLGDAEKFCVARDKTLPTWTYTRKLK